jgi:predicted phage terminase large subunit-like protein
MLPKNLPELLKNKESLTTPQLMNLLKEIKDYAASIGIGTASLPDNPADFAVQFSKGRWQKFPHLERLSQELSDLEQGRNNRLLVTFPPRHGKSFLISVWFPLWLLARNPKRKVVVLGHEAEFAAGWGRQVRNWIIENGEQFNLRLDPGTTAADRWTLTAGGGMTTAGSKGVVGRGADALIIDDPYADAEEAMSEVIREKVWDGFVTGALTRLEPGGFVVVLHQRWHEDDLIGKIVKLSESGEFPKFRIVNFPAIAGENDVLGRKIGEPLWPERFPLETEERDGRIIIGLNDIRKGMSPYQWSSLYMQSPTPEEGNAVKRSWWKFYNALPADIDVWIQSWDLAFKDMKQSDYTVGQVWARRGAEIYLIDQVRDHMNARDVISQIRQWKVKYPLALAKVIEDKASGPAVIQILQKEVQGMIPMKAVGSKDQRLQSVIPLIEAGNVFLPNPEKNRWVWEFIEEFAAFPRGTYDDQLDAGVHALRYMIPQGWLYQAKVKRKEALDAATETNPLEIHSKLVMGGISKAVKKAGDKFNKQAMNLGRSRYRGRW